MLIIINNKIIPIIAYSCENNKTITMSNKSYNNVHCEIETDIIKVI